MAEAVYLLCALTSIACAALLLRGYLATRTSLLFWSCLCFTAFAINNVLLFVDLVIYPERDILFFGVLSLAITRGAVSLAGLGLLLFGLIWESH